MPVTVSDVLTKVKNYARNQNLDSVRGISAIDSATAFVLNHMGVPGYENFYTFDYVQDQNLYNLPTYIGELISLRFTDNNFNKPNKPFVRHPAEYLFSRIKNIQKDTMLYGDYVASGNNELIVLAQNTMAIIPIYSFDYNNAINWLPTLDANSIIDDHFIYEEGSGSLRFTITPTASLRASLTYNSLFDLSQYATVGHFKIYFWTPTLTGLSSVSLTWGTDNANYYKSTVTTQEDGSALQANYWNRLDFPWATASLVGSPQANDLVYWKLDVDYLGTFVGGNAFRYDYLRVATPDNLTLTYYTANKGTTSTGTALTTFTATTDLFLIAANIPEVSEMIAIHAAVILNPTILVDDASVRKLYTEFYTLFARRFPRKRSLNLLTDPILSKTSSDINIQ
jgi:hypothetical protein